MDIGMKYKGIIFDLDGVICSTDKYHYRAWKEVTDSKEIYFDERINNRLRGVSRMESLDIILENYHGLVSKEEKIELADKKNKLYVRSLEEMSYKDFSIEVKSTLEELEKRGYLLAIGSSSKNAKYILERLECKEYFKTISDGTNITNSKPDPEVFLKAAKYLDLNPKDCLVVEDAKAGIDAAVNGQFDSAGIGEASRYKKCTYSLNKFEDLLNIL